MESAISLTEKLRAFSSVNRESANALVQEILPRMKRIAAARLNRERAGIQLTPTELVGEVWATSLHNGHWDVQSREHFFGIVGLAMQNVLIDMARRRLARRHGSGAAHLCLDELAGSDQPATASAEEVIAISELLEQLALEDERIASVVRLHYLIGFSLQETGRELGLTHRQVRHRWEKGKAWLAIRLNTRRANLTEPPPDHE